MLAHSFPTRRSSDLRGYREILEGIRSFEDKFYLSLSGDNGCAGESKTLLCSGISFHFWHCRKSNLVKHSVQRYELFRRFFARRRFFTARRRSGLSAAIAISGCGCPISRAIRCVARVEECAAETRYKGVLRSLRPANTPAIDPHVGILSGSSSG